MFVCRVSLSGQEHLNKPHKSELHLQHNLLQTAQNEAENILSAAATAAPGRAYVTWCYQAENHLKAERSRNCSTLRLSVISSNESRNELSCFSLLDLKL